jgi:phosphoribosyl 1,2-cyclic phosphodiesterase
MRQGQPVQAHLMLGHTHWDHISGFPFFTPVFARGNQVTIYGARDLDRSLRDVLAGQMHYTYFPVPLGDLQADITFTELEEGSLQVQDATIRTHYLNHTAVCLGYRVEADGVSLAYITDHEPYGPLNDDNGFVHGGDRRLVEFVRGVDLLIQDAQYTPEEYLERRGWGHGSTDYVTDVAIGAAVHRLALFHHEPTHADDEVDRMVAYARQRVAKRGCSELEVFAAAEGAELTV